MTRSTGQIVALVFGVIFVLSGIGATISGAMLQATGFLAGLASAEIASGIVLLLVGIILIVFGARDRPQRSTRTRRSVMRRGA